MMQDENSSSSNSKQTIVQTEDFVVGTDDLGKFVGDTSFSDVTSDDSSGWMHKIDVTNFQRLTSTSSINDNTPTTNGGGAGSNLHELAPVSTFLIESKADLQQPKMEIEIEGGDEDEEVKPKHFGHFPLYGGRSAAMEISKHHMPTISRSSRPYDSNFRLTKLSQPMKKTKRSESTSSSARNIKCGTGESIIDQHQAQISVVSSSTDAATNRHGLHGIMASQRQYAKPVYSYSCMIALALKNSQLGRLQVAEIYCFMCENFPYFRTAPAGWKNSVRHNLSLNKCFEKIEVEAPGGHGRKCCLWKLNPQKVTKMEQEIRKYREKDPAGVREAYARPDEMDLVEQGLKGMPNKPTIFHSGRTTLPDVVQQVTVDFQHQPTPLPVEMTDGFGNSFQSNMQAGYVGVGKSELALKLLQQAAGYGQGQWSLHLPAPQSTAEQAAAAAAGPWLPPQLENNRNRFTPTHQVEHCPLDFSPDHHVYNNRPPSSPPPFSTPIRRSSVAACFSPFSMSQPDPHQNRPSSLNQYQNQETAPSSIWRQQNSPLFVDARQQHPILRQHRTPERPASCGYFFGDGIMGGNQNSLLVTPTNESQLHRGPAFGTSLESAFCAATTHNNSLIMQSMQQHMMQQDEPTSRQQQEIYQFQSVAGSSLDGSLHLTTL